MIKFILSALIFLMHFFSFTAQSQSDKLCEVYGNTYDSSNKELSDIYNEGLSDNSAPRETNRQLRIISERILQMMILTQMQHHKCKLPKQPSGWAEYALPSIQCAVERLDMKLDSPKCDWSKWESAFKGLDHFK